MGETLMQPCRVCEEGLRVVKHFQRGGRRELQQGLASDVTRRRSAETLPAEEAPANSVPAAAVIRRAQALIGITGRKARAGGHASQM